MITKSEDEWKDQLTTEQFRILRKAGQSDQTERSMRNSKNRGREFTSALDVIRSCFPPGRNLIHIVVGLLSLIHPKLKMLKLRSIISLAIPELKCCVRSAMVTLGMSLPVRVLILQPIKGTA